MDLRCRYSASLKVAVTGATGYIGARLISLSGTKDFSPCLIDQVEPGCALIHLGAAVNPTRDAFLQNLAADTWLLERTREGRFSQIIYASSNNVYPLALDCRPGDTTRCNDYYSASKVFGEQLFAEFSAVPTVSVRIADVFGVGQKHGNFFKAVEQAIVDRTALQKYGLGLKRRSYIHVDELCGMLLHLVHEQYGSVGLQTVFNACYSDAATVAEIVDKVAGVTGLPIERVVLAQDHSSLDVRTMKSVLPQRYALRWPTFRDALDEYVQQIISRR